jgi:hypothetical protein
MVGGLETSFVYPSSCKSATLAMQLHQQIMKIGLRGNAGFL